MFRVVDGYYPPSMRFNSLGNFFTERRSDSGLKESSPELRETRVTSIQFPGPPLRGAILLR